MGSANQAVSSVELMSTDQEIYQRLGEILSAVVPQQAQWVSVEVELSPTGDHAKLFYDYQAEGSEPQWFVPEPARVDHDIRLLLIQLREYFAGSNLFERDKPWARCMIKLDLQTGKLAADFKYE
ncbi:hypothetical protein IAE35_18085 [Pseudomonas sp. S75]|uniref:hypothetical protein n=1 Tax=unclassified Pseudomonas TaxID=196821 RepID=UPI001902F0DB|nr:MULTISPECIES: hypothetical protein [unclassified Pseudomonas]MBJ9977592.1 hypothetical protein [Pseudomonas sp. S30]MBK0155256.1 hypothetical protein [Pseudomonas sp. S75]